MGAGNFDHLGCLDLWKKALPMSCMMMTVMGKDYENPGNYTRVYVSKMAE